MGMAEAGGGGGEVAVEPRAAREYVSQFVPDAKVVATMADPDVVAYHGKVKTAVDTAVANAIKERGEFGPEWRKAIAGDDANAMPTLERFQTPKALYESYNTLRTKMASGELKAITPYPAQGTDEQKSAWRAEQGLPTKAEDYKIEPPPGMVIGEADKPFVDGWRKAAFDQNLSPQAVNAGVAYWTAQRLERQEAAALQDKQQRQEVEDKLRSDWGVEYRGTMGKIEAMIDGGLPADAGDIKKAILNTVATSREFAAFMGKIAFQLNPMGSSVPAGEEGQIKSVTDWLTAAENLMRTDRNKYNKSEYSNTAKFKQYADAYRTQTGKEWAAKG